MVFLHNKNKVKTPAQTDVKHECCKSTEDKIKETQSDTQSVPKQQHARGSEPEESQVIADVNTTSPIEEKNTDRTEVDTKSQEATTSQQHHVLGTSKNSSKRKVSTDSNVSGNAQSFDMKKLAFEKKQKKENLLPRRDKYDVFGEMVAHGIRSLNADYAKITMQHCINNILYRARVGSYAFPQHPVLIAPLPSTSPTITSDQSTTSATELETTPNNLHRCIELSSGSDTSNDTSVN